MLHVSEDDVVKNLPMADAIRLVRESFRSAQAINQPRRRMTTPAGPVLHSLAGAFGPYFGTKIYSTSKHGAYFFVLLFESSTGRPLAFIDANRLGQIRTGAASAVAAEALANPQASVLAIIGSGFQAQTQIEAISHVRDLRDVRVWSRDRARREAFAAAHKGRATETAREAVTGAHIVVTATNAKDPVIESSWISAGTLVIAMGSNQPTRRELPADLVNRAALVIVDSIEQSRVESGDLLLAWTEDQWRSPGLMELRDVLRAGHTYRPDEVTIFKSNGLGVQDVAVAGHVYETILARPSEGPDPSTR